MSVTKEITRLEKSNVKLSLTVPKEDVQAQYRDLMKEYTQNVQIPGFRKGKVPQEVLERKFGEALKGEALGKIIEKAVEEVFDEENLSRQERPLPYSRPEIQEEPKLDLEQDLSFSMIYDVFPEVNVGKWKGLEIEVPEAAVTDEDINRELEEIRDRNAFVLDREEGAAAKNGDVVTVSYCEIDEKGDELPHSRRDGFAFTLGSGNNVYEIDDDIAGMKKGETKEVVKTYPEGDRAANPLAGKTMKLRLTLDALKEKKLPDLDDELAQDVDEKYQTLDDLKNSIRKRLEDTLNHRLKDMKISKILEKVVETTPITLPESMVRVELEGRLRNLARQFGTDTDKIMEMLAQTGDGLDNINEKWRPSAEKALKSRLIVETLIGEQHIEASDEDLEKELEKVSSESGEALDAIKNRYGGIEGGNFLRESIKEDKFFDLLMAENTIKTGSKVKYLDLLAKNE